MTTVEINGKRKEIPESTISKNMEILGISRQEAIDMWLCDEGYQSCKEVEELTEKAKQLPRKNAKSDKPRKKSSPRTKKQDEIKVKIIKILANALENEGISVEVTNPGKIIEFSTDSADFKIDLIRKRKKTQ